MQTNISKLYTIPMAKRIHNTSGGGEMKRQGERESGRNEESERTTRIRPV